MESIIGRYPGGVAADPAPDVAIAPERVHDVLARHVLADGFKLVYDTKASHGSWIVDARTGEEYLDLYTFFASAPLGSNPRGLADDPEFMAVLADAAANKPANPDMYTTHYARVREDVRAGTRRPRAAAPVLRRGRRARRRERAEDRVRLEEPPQRGGGPVPPGSAARCCTSPGPSTAGPGTPCR